MDNATELMRIDGILTDVRNAVVEAIETTDEFAIPDEGYKAIRELADALYDETSKNDGRAETALAIAESIAAMAVRYILDFEDIKSGGAKPEEPDDEDDEEEEDDTAA